MFHPARIFTSFMVLFLSIVCVFTMNLPSWKPPVFFVLILCGLLYLGWRKRPIRYLLLAAIIIATILLRVWALTPDGSNTWWNAPRDNVSGDFIINSEPKVVGKNQSFLVGSLSGSPKGNIEVYVNQFPGWRFGEIITLDGDLLSVDQTMGLNKSQQIVARMSYPEIRTAKGQTYPTFLDRMYYPVRAYLIGVKNSFVEKTGQILPEPEAGLLSGILFGTKAELSTYLISILAITGTVHIIALSGYNITIVAKGSQSVTKGLSRNMAFLAPTFGIILFVLATGLSASIVRAAVMGVMLLLAARLGRQSDALNSILFASCIMAFLNPYIVLYDIGFQLSFAAVSGIIFFQPVIEPYFRRFGRIVGPILAGTFAAQIFSWPVIAYYFGRVSLISVLANALVLPMIPLVMLLGFLVVSLGFLSLGLAKFFGLFVWGLLYYILRINEYLASFKFASVTYQSPSIYLVLAYFLFLFEITYYLNQRRKKIEIKKS